MSKTYYKVVCLRDGSRYSAHATGFAEIEYPPYARVEADHRTAGIFVFKDESIANDFGRYICYPHTYLVIPCKGHGPARHYKKIVLSDQSLINKFLYKQNWNKQLLTQDVPKSTICFPAITLLG